jgi:methylated-DNA-protein-cysteine methyltransferase related protein
MREFTQRAMSIIKQIPPGKVMTYGQVAKLAGSPKGARQVVRILHSMSEKYKLPWHRVINAKGELSLKEEDLLFSQKMALEAEGIQFTNDRFINLEEYQFHPDDVK